MLKKVNQKRESSLNLEVCFSVFANQICLNQDGIKSFVSKASSHLGILLQPKPSPHHHRVLFILLYFARV